MTAGPVQWGLAPDQLKVALANLRPDELAEVDALLAVPQTFREFATKANPHYIWWKHCELLADELEKVARGETKRLMVFMPPRHGKSEEISRLFPAYYLSCFPSHWVAIASYSFELARTFSRAARAAYAEVTNDLSNDSTAVEMWETKSGGGLWAVGRGGSATGRGAHLFIVDDPLKDQAEAESEVVREGLHDWYKSVVNTRLEPNGACVIVHTRWNEADLAGELLDIEATSEQPEYWRVVNLPAIAERPEERTIFPNTVTVVDDWRQPGEPLCPDRYSVERLRAIRATSGERVWNALYQQKPVEAGGQVFKREWWRYYGLPQAPRPKQFSRVVQSWDCTFKDTDGTDFVCGQVWGQVGARFYLLDEVRERLSFSGTCAAIKALRGKWPEAHAIYVEDKANGPAVIDALLRQVPGIVAVEPEGGKIARAYAQQPLVEAHQVFLPDPSIAPWVEDFLRECASFPNGRHDDRVDAFTQAMAKLAWSGTERLANGQRTIAPDQHPGYDSETHRRQHPQQVDPWAPNGHQPAGGPQVRMPGRKPTFRATWNEE